MTKYAQKQLKNLVAAGAAKDVTNATAGSIMDEFIIENSVLVECVNKNLGMVKIPDSVTSISSGAFFYCTSLTNVTIPNSVVSIGCSTFYNCTSLTNVTIPNSVVSIGSCAFYNCKSLTNVTIPNSVTSIDKWAFSDCTNLTNVTIPDSVTSIDKCAFSDCTSLNQKRGFYKAFHKDGGKLCCHHFEFEIGKSYHQNGDIKICENGFHYCTRMSDIFNYYDGSIGDDIVICEIEPSGAIDMGDYDSKCCASDIKVVRELQKSEIFSILNNKYSVIDD